MDEVTRAINHFSVLMEDQNSKLDAVLEHLGSLPKIQDFRRLEGKVDSIDQSLGAVEVAVKATNKDVADLKRDTQVSELRLHDIFRDLDEHVHLPAHGKEMLSS